MATREIIDRDFCRLFFSLCLIAVILGLAGCATAQIKQIHTKSETELAIEAYKDEWLKECDGVAPGESVNAVGTLLDDYNTAASALAVCRARHNDSAAYLRGVVAKEKAK